MKMSYFYGRCDRGDKSLHSSRMAHIQGTIKEVREFFNYLIEKHFDIDENLWTCENYDGSCDGYIAVVDKYDYEHYRDIFKSYVRNYL